MGPPPGMGPGMGPPHMMDMSMSRPYDDGPSGPPGGFPPPVCLSLPLSLPFSCAGTVE